MRHVTTELIKIIVVKPGFQVRPPINGITKSPPISKQTVRSRWLEIFGYILSAQLQLASSVCVPNIILLCVISKGCSKNDIKGHDGEWTRVTRVTLVYGVKGFSPPTTNFLRFRFVFDVLSPTKRFAVDGASSARAKSVYKTEMFQDLSGTVSSRLFNDSAIIFISYTKSQTWAVSSALTYEATVGLSYLTDSA
ncbi:hypothetical protein ElyMa_005523300 [Elysia marginata]|uniref:Uncharacterized protein n=1 Tax=Elysia marginata TaxID=1093978 RepID=A0AAV4EWJ0_9GAST|nr:hypothetical protein ElyMa_005523300 [Elysia marginata]